MDAKVLSIIRLLTEQTVEGKIKWDATGTANEYKVVMDGGTVVVSSFLSTGATITYGFKLYNKVGILALQENCTRLTENYSDLYSLYTAAKDSYTQKDTVIDDILSQLKK